MSQARIVKGYAYYCTCGYATDNYNAFQKHLDKGAHEYNVYIGEYAHPPKAEMHD